VDRTVVVPVTERTLSEPPDSLRRQSSGEQAALYIRRLIFDGELRPGMRVPQDQVAQQLGISRIPVREALITLQNEGWVSIELHRGAFINALDQTWVRDHYELYGLIYGFAAQKATERFGSSLAGQLAPLVADVGQSDDPRSVTRLALAFHGAVVDAAGSPRVKVMLRGMSPMVPGDFFDLVPGAVAIERKGLADIARAIGRGDGPRACERYLRLMQQLGQVVVELFTARGLFTTPSAAGRTATGA
jgi:DNA-binding GntR family transcriptional regulator